MDAEQPFCTFFLDGLWFGIDVESVKEVVGPQAMTRVPLAPDAIAGLINLRGQIVTVINLRRRLGLPLHSSGHRSMNVVLKGAANEISLLVDEVGEVVEAGENSYQPVPESLSAEARNLVPGVYQLPAGLLHVLTPSAVCSGYVEETKTAPRREQR